MSGFRGMTFEKSLIAFDSASGQDEQYKSVVSKVIYRLNEIHRGNMTPMAEEAWNEAIEMLRKLLH